LRSHFWNKDQEKAQKLQLRLGRDKPWFSVGEYDNNSEMSLNLVTDDGKALKIGAFWCGYFEKLYGAEILSPNDKFTVD
jgi:hypothetical protein